MREVNVNFDLKIDHPYTVADRVVTFLTLK